MGVGPPLHEPGGAEEFGALRGRLAVVAIGALFEGGLAALAWGLGAWLGHPPGATLTWDGRAVLLGTAAALPLMVVPLASLRARRGPLARIRAFLGEVVRPVLGDCSAPELALIATAAGFGEELFFRGVLQAALADRLGPWGGLAAASLLFGLMHPITPTYVALAGVMGAYLGLVWVASGNLLAAVVAHAVYDFLALVLLLRSPTEGSPADLDPPAGS